MRGVHVASWVAVDRKIDSQLQTEDLMHNDMVVLSKWHKFCFTMIGGAARQTTGSLGTYTSTAQ